MTPPVVTNTHDIVSSKIPLVIYPNPSEGIITIELKETSMEYRIQLKNVNGQVIRSIDGLSGSTQLNLSDVHKGIYFLSVFSKKGISTKKILLH